MSKMGATPLYLAIILVQANAYSRASVMLHVSGTENQPENWYVYS